MMHGQTKNQALILVYMVRKYTTVRIIGIPTPPFVCS